MKIAYLMQEGGPDVRKRPHSGPANHVWQVYNELKARGHQLCMIARYDGQIWKSEDLNHFEHVYIRKNDEGFLRLVERFVRGIQSRLRLPYINMFESYRFAEACSQELGGFELLYERLGWMGFGAGIAARRMRIPLVGEANSGDFFFELENEGYTLHGLQRWLAINLMRRAVHSVNYIVASGAGHRERFIGLWGVNPRKISVVENGSELVDTLSRDKLLSFQDNKEPIGEIKILYLGSFKPWSGLNILIKAMSKVIQEMPMVRLTLIGSGNEREEVIKLIHDLNLDAYVELKERMHLHQAVEYLIQADIGVSPYCGWVEYSGLKLFDYKAAGLAIVASGENGHPMTLKHGQTGWIVPPCDCDALSDALIKLSSDVELRCRMGQAARKEAEVIHSWRHTAEELEKIFVEVHKM